MLQIHVWIGVLQSVGCSLSASCRCWFWCGMHAASKVCMTAMILGDLGTRGLLIHFDQDLGTHQLPADLELDLVTCGLLNCGRTLELVDFQPFGPEPWKH